MKHIQYGVNYVYLVNGQKRSCIDEIWMGTDDIGKNEAINKIADYTKLNEECIAKNKPIRHKAFLISRELNNVYVEGNLSAYYDEEAFEENLRCFALSNEDLEINNINSLFENFVGHKVKISIEYLD